MSLLGQTNFVRALMHLADQMGLELIRQVFDMSFTPGVQVNTQRFTPDAGDGPFIITELEEEKFISSVLNLGAQTNNTRIEIVSGSRRITDGRVVVNRSLNVFRANNNSFVAFAVDQGFTAGMPPIVIGRGDTMTVVVDADTGNNIDASNVLALRGFSVRKKGTLERVGAEADRFAALVRERIGEMYILELSAPANGGLASFPISKDVRWLYAGMLITNAPTALQLRLRSIDVFPRQLQSAAPVNAGINFSLPWQRTRIGDLAEWRVQGGGVGPNSISMVGCALADNVPAP